MWMPQQPSFSRTDAGFLVQVPLLSRDVAPAGARIQHMKMRERETFRAVLPPTDQRHELIVDLQAGPAPYPPELANALCYWLQGRSPAFPLDTLHPSEEATSGKALAAALSNGGRVRHFGLTDLALATFERQLTEPRPITYADVVVPWAYAASAAAWWNRLFANELRPLGCACQAIAQTTFPTIKREEELELLERPAAIRIMVEHLAPVTVPEGVPVAP